MPLDRPIDAVHRTVDAWLTPRRAVTASVASFTLVALIAATPGSPYHPVLPDDTGGGPLGLLTRLLWMNHIPHGLLIAIGFVAMMAAGVAFLLVLYACERGLVPIRTVIDAHRRLRAHDPPAAPAALPRRLQLHATTDASSRSTTPTRTSRPPPTTPRRT